MTGDARGQLPPAAGAIHGKSYLRFSAMNPYPEEKHVVGILEQVEQLAKDLKAEA